MGTKRAQPETLPTTLVELEDWMKTRVPMPISRRAEIIRALTAVLDYQRQILEQAKRDAIQAVSEGFADKLSRLHAELVAKEATVSSVSRYFEDVVAELTEKSHRDPKTKLMNFDWFMERLESYLALEQRVRWCAVGVVDINSFKWVNDNFGHAVGDQIIERVAMLLSEQIRSADLLAQDPRGAPDLHARFGGDEFCFFIPNLPGPDEALVVANRFKHAVEAFDWSTEHPKLRAQPIRVDVGVVSLQLGPIDERRGSARSLAGELIQSADRLMYEAKGLGADRARGTQTRIESGLLVEIGSTSSA